MKNKILLTGILTVALTFTINAYAADQNNSDSASGENQQQAQIQVRAVSQSDNAQVEVKDAKDLNNGEATTSQSTDKNQEKDQNKAQIKNGVGTSSEDQAQGRDQKGQINAEEHRSAVANFVQGLLQVADREGGIGQKVKAIAQEQDRSASTTIQAVEKIQNRNKIATFLFGSDYKNLGALRSEIVQTQNRLDQLKSLSENVQSAADKTNLQNQIQTLEQEQSKVSDFVNSQENQFSLLGWFVKLFNK